MKKTYADICIERSEKAHEHLCEICEKPRSRFRMSIPVQKDDSDMVLQAPIDDAVELAKKLKRAIEAIEKIAYWKSDARVCCFPVDCHALIQELESMPENLETLKDPLQSK